MKKSLLWRICAVVSACALAMPWSVASALEPLEDTSANEPTPATTTTPLNTSDAASATPGEVMAALPGLDGETGDNVVDTPSETDSVSSAASSTTSDSADAADESTASHENADTTVKPRVRRAAPAAAASGEIVAGDFASLKAAIENPDRATELVVPEGTYVFTDTITVSKDLTIKNEAGKKVVFELGMFNQDAGSLGKTMMDVTAGTLTLDADANENLVFDGKSGLPAFDHTAEIISNESMEINNNVSDRGVFITYNPGVNGVINHATFTNVSNGGGNTGAIFLKATSKVTMNDGLFTHNHLSFQKNISNSWYLSEENQNFFARSANVGVLGGTFIMNGGAIDDNYASFEPAAAIGTTGAVYGGGVVRSKIEINGGSISKNSAHRFADNGGITAGGAIYLGVNSDMVINDGTFSDNYVKGSGGFLWADWGTSLAINGGTFANNKSDQSGGVFGAYDRFMVYDPSSSSNVSGSKNAYGISDINVWYKQYRLGCKVTINGGTFDNNQSYMGGAIYLGCDGAVINGATFVNNKANRFGGALYVASQPYTLTIRNAYVTDNTADDNSITLGSDLYPDLDTNIFTTSSGGGIWYCPTGNGDINVSNGLAAFGNNAVIEGDDFTSMKKSATDYKVSVANRMLGGGYVGWYADTTDDRYAAGDEELEPIVDSEDNLALHSSISERSQETAKAVATSVFMKNAAKRGGAIASNGKVVFGDANLTFNLEVAKDWSPLVTDKPELTAELYIVTTENGEEKEHFSDSVKLNAENNFKATFKDLPLENHGKTTYRIKEVGDDYETSYTTQIADNDATAGNTFNTADVINGDTVKVTISNKPLFAITHEFKSVTEGKDLPAAVTDQLPVNLDKQKIGTEYTPANPTNPEVREGYGTWKFIEWTPATDTVVDKDLHFVGTWEYVEDPTYQATYEFKSGTEGKELPGSIVEKTPAAISGLHTGDSASATNPDETTVVVDDGEWTFESWDMTEQTVTDADLHFVGTWVFHPYFNITHEFKSVTEGKDLPSEVTDQLPANLDKQKIGTEYTPANPTNPEVREGYGTWKFIEWTPATDTVVDKDLHFVGTWEYVEDPTYQATYEFKSGTEGKELPEGILKFLHPTVTGLHAGDTANTGAYPVEKTFTVSDGTWKFVSWDMTEQTIKDADVHFIGTWVFEKNSDPKTYNATFEYRSKTEGKDLPDEILKLTPAKQADLTDGTTVNALDPEQMEFKVEGGTWKFVGWDENTLTIKGADIHFIGYWEFVADEPPLKPEPEDTTPKTQPESKVPKTGEAPYAAGVLALLSVATLGALWAYRKRRA